MSFIFQKQSKTEKKDKDESKTKRKRSVKESVDTGKCHAIRLIRMEFFKTFLL